MQSAPGSLAGGTTMQERILFLRSPWIDQLPFGSLSGMSDAANDGGGGRSTLIGGSAVASGSAMVAPDELPEQPAPTRTNDRRLPTSAIRDIGAPRKGVISTEFVTR